MRRILVALGALSLAAIFAVPTLISGTPWGPEADPEWLWSEFLDTPGATPWDARCEQLYGSGHTCVEWCDVYQGPTIVPRGQFCCEDDGHPGCSKPLH